MSFKHRLLDADFIINFSKTMVATQYNKSFSFSPKNLDMGLITTKEVKKEVIRNPIDKNFMPSIEITQLKKFQNYFLSELEIYDGTDLHLMELTASTELKNLGEKSLTCLLFEKYRKALNNNDIAIVSNNKNDIIHFANTVKKFTGYEKLKWDQNKNIISLHKFYYELYKAGLFKRQQIAYLLAISNIDARIVGIDLESTFGLLFV